MENNDSGWKNVQERKSLWRFLFAAMAVYAGVNLLIDLAAWLIVKVYGGLSFAVPSASTIGIIGGADGPTAVFVTASVGSAWQMFGMILLLAVGILGYLKLSRFGKK